MHKIINLLLLSCFLFFGTAKIPVKNPPKQVAKKINIDEAIIALQKTYNNANSSTFSFRQKYTHPVFPINEDSLGQVFFKRGNMKWVYEKPRKKSIIVKGNKLIIFIEEDKIAYENDCFQEDTLSASIKFLMGKGNIKESFHIKLHEDKSLNQNLLWLAHTPKEKQSAIKMLYFGLNKLNYQVMESLVVDQNDGKNHFSFTNLKINPEVLDSTFDFNPPKGTKIEKMPGQSCENSKVEPAKAVKGVKKP